ncbi:MAG: YicC/YloC family endoribonuclease [Gemmatimonadota bacterium]
MTGFGDAEADAPVGRLRLEIRTVNHRFLNTSVKTPPGFDRFEQHIVAAIKERISRGHVSAFLSLDRSAARDSGAAGLDLDRARRYRDALQALQDEFDLPGAVDLATLARFGEIFREPEPGSAADLEPELFLDLTREALAGVVALREAEGERLRADLAGRLDALAGHLEEIRVRAPQRLVAERDRLREAVRELTEQVEVDEDRLAREVAYLADRWDISEEMVRFGSHMELFREALSAPPEEPVGKRLGFLVQEMLREVNTMGSKANDAAIAQAVVAMKEEIERLREQVENVE